MTFKEYYGEEQCQAIRERLEDFFEGEGGFLFIDNVTQNRCTDAYMAICDHHVLKRVAKMTADAIHIGHPGLEAHMGKEVQHDHDKH